MNDKAKPRIRKIRHSPVADPEKLEAAREAVKRVKARNERFEELKRLHRKTSFLAGLPGYTHEYIRLLEAKVRDMERTWEPPVPHVVANKGKR